MLHKTSTIFFAIFAFLAIVFLIRFLILGQAVYGDGRYYFAYVRSAVIDHDLNFINEMGHRYDHNHNNNKVERDADVLNANTPTGLHENKYPIGAPLLWLAPHASAHILASTFSKADDNFPNNGYSNIYQYYVGIFNIAIVTGGLFIIYNLLLKFFDKNVAIFSVIGIIFGSNLFYYSAIDAINSHPASFITSAIFIYYLILAHKSKKTKDYFILGAVTGLIALIRTQDLIFLLLPFALIVSSPSTLKTKVKYFVHLITAFGMVFSLQLLSWKVIYGTYFAFPYISKSEGFNFLNPHLIELLTNIKNGLLIWSPLYVVSFVGLILFRKRNKFLGDLFIGFFLIQLYLISSWSGWSQGEAFGTRMLISSLPLLSFGLAEVLFRINSFKSKILVGVLILFNFVAIFYFLIVVQNPTYNIKQNTQDEAFRKIEKLFIR